MKLSEILTQLTHGELSNVFIGGAEAGQVTEANLPIVVSHINLGLMALYKRFPLKQNRVKLNLQSGYSNYPITSAFAVSNTSSSEPVKYLDDTGNPFKDDILKIERVYNSNNVEFPLNDDGSTNSLFTPTATTLNIPLTVSVVLLGNQLDIVYRAMHPLIVIGDGAFNPEMVDVELPYSHLEPLLLYVASRVNSPLGMVNEFNASNSYAAKYELACQQLEQLNLRVDQGNQFNRLQKNGWV